MPTEVLDSALSLAARFPDALLPCPLCESSVKGANLGAHLSKSHSSASPIPHALRGADRTPLIPLTALAFGSMVVLVLLELSGELSDLRAGVLLAFTLGGMGGAAVTSLELLPATLTVEGERLRLRFALGILSRDLPLRGLIEVGALRESRSSPLSPRNEQYSEDVRAGSYLRIEGAGRAIVIGCRRGTRLRKHWEGFRPGPTRRRWDVTLEPLAMVALEHHLARAGALTPRPLGAGSGE